MKCTTGCAFIYSNFMWTELTSTTLTPTIRISSSFSCFSFYVTPSFERRVSVFVCVCGHFSMVPIPVNNPFLFSWFYSKFCFHNPKLHFQIRAIAIYLPNELDRILNYDSFFFVLSNYTIYIKDKHSCY